MSWSNKNYMKISYMGRRLNGQYDSFKSKVRRGVQFVKKMIKLTVLAGIFIGIGVGVTSSSAVAYVQPEVQLVHAETPVLDRIADCESGVRDAHGKAIKGSARQFDKNGQVVMNVNKTGKYAGSVDIGKYGVNVTIWGKKAGELGYNLATEEGNKGMAVWLYENMGTEPWSGTSGSCWR